MTRSYTFFFLLLFSWHVLNFSPSTPPFFIFADSVILLFLFFLSHLHLSLSFIPPAFSPQSCRIPVPLSSSFTNVFFFFFLRHLAPPHFIFLYIHVFSLLYDFHVLFLLFNPYLVPSLPFIPTLVIPFIGLCASLPSFLLPFLPSPGQSFSSPSFLPHFPSYAFSS